MAQRPLNHGRVGGEKIDLEERRGKMHKGLKVMTIFYFRPAVVGRFRLAENYDNSGVGSHMGLALVMANSAKS
jgi:hypothetical protein